MIHTGSKDAKALQRARELTSAAEEMRKRGRDLVKQETRDRLPPEIMARIEALERRYLELMQSMQALIQHIGDQGSTIQYIVENGQAVPPDEQARKRG